MFLASCGGRWCLLVSMLLPIALFFDYCPPLSSALSVATVAAVEVSETETETGIASIISDGVEVSKYCPICLQGFDNPSVLLKCQHIFCMECILSWFKTRLECPLCKVSSSYILQTTGSLQGTTGKAVFKLWKVWEEGNIISGDGIPLWSDSDYRNAVVKLRKTVDIYPASRTDGGGTVSDTSPSLLSRIGAAFNSSTASPNNITVTSKLSPVPSSGLPSDSSSRLPMVRSALSRGVADEDPLALNNTPAFTHHAAADEEHTSSTLSLSTKLSFQESVDLELQRINDELLCLRDQLDITTETTS